MGFILNIHHVNDKKWFDDTIVSLKKKYKLVQLPELISLYNNRSSLANICHITVDDGDKSFYNTIFPVLKKRKVPASLYVSPYIAVNQSNFWFQEISDYDDQKLLEVISEVIKVDLSEIRRFSSFNVIKCLTIDRIWDIITRYRKKHKIEIKVCQNMTVDELREVERSGLVVIGAHTMRHPVLANELDSVSEYEIESSISELSELLGHEIRYFAYPNGFPGLDFGYREMSTIRKNGCICSFCTAAGRFTLKSDLLSMPRYGLTSGEKSYYTRAKILSGSNWNWIMRLKCGNEFSQRRVINVGSNASV
jgi:peptidoglycan/xylan/chitin deacetylase (PgdA/CDA1 family)